MSSSSNMPDDLYNWTAELEREMIKQQQNNDKEKERKQKYPKKSSSSPKRSKSRSVSPKSSSPRHPNLNNRLRFEQNWEKKIKTRSKSPVKKSSSNPNISRYNKSKVLKYPPREYLNLNSERNQAFARSPIRKYTPKRSKSSNKFVPIPRNASPKFSPGFLPNYYPLNHPGASTLSPTTQKEWNDFFKSSPKGSKNISPNRLNYLTRLYASDPDPSKSPSKYKDIFGKKSFTKTPSPLQRSNSGLSNPKSSTSQRSKTPSSQRAKTSLPQRSRTPSPKNKTYNLPEVMTMNNYLKQMGNILPTLNMSSPSPQQHPSPRRSSPSSRSVSIRPIATPMLEPKYGGTNSGEKNKRGRTIWRGSGGGRYVLTATGSRTAIRGNALKKNVEAKRLKSSGMKDKKGRTVYIGRQGGFFLLAEDGTHRVPVRPFTPI